MHSLPRRRRRPRLRTLAVAGAALAAAATPAFAAFTLDGTTANVPGNLQPAGEPKVVLGGLKGTGNARVPWLSQTEPNVGGGPSQIFVEKFAAGQFSQQGDSLNFNPAENAGQSTIDFAGKGFSVPWTGWEEDAGGVSQIFASKFNPNADLSNGAWEINGALRTSPANPAVQRGPSLNFNVDRGADEPEVAGGTLNPANDPTPWVTWEEDATPPGIGKQIFVTKGVKDSTPGPAQRGPFTWHIQGSDRGLTPAQAALLGPTLNVQISPTIDGVHPDNTFTGAGNTVPWTVWYEEPNNLPPNAEPAAPANLRVFAAKLVPDPALGDRGGRWTPVGNGPGCVFQPGAEDPNACSLNKVGTANAENPSVAAGSLDPAKPTVPWVVWREATGTAPHQIFLSRLNPAANRFDIFDGPNANGSVNADVTKDADEPDIRFDGNILHVTWKEPVADGHQHVFERHFTPGAGGQGGAWSPAQDLTVDPSLESGNPALGTFGASPFVTWAEGAANGAGDVFGHTLLKHEPANVTAQTQAATDITGTTATLHGLAAGDPGVLAGSFDVTPETNGKVGATQTVGAQDVTHNAPDPSQPFTFPLTGLAPNTVVHVKAKVATAFGAIAGAQQDFVTAGSGAPGAVGLPPVPRKVKIVSRVHRVRVTFTISRKWKVKIVAHRGTRRGPVVGRLTAKFKKGRNSVLLSVRATGRVVILIQPRAGKVLTRTVFVR